jgi:hypothetical protein
MWGVNMWSNLHRRRVKWAGVGRLLFFYGEHCVVGKNSNKIVEIIRRGDMSEHYVLVM